MHCQVDAEAVANMLGLAVVPLKLEFLQGLMVDDCIGVAEPVGDHHGGGG